MPLEFDLFYVLLVLLVTSRAFGEVAERIGQPALVGELIAGIALGATVATYPATFPNLADLAHNEVFVTITELGMFFLMLFAHSDAKRPVIPIQSGH